MSGIGTPGLIVILLVAILLFGPKKLPELGASIGKTLREFKKASREITASDNRSRKQGTGSRQTGVKARHHKGRRREAEIKTVRTVLGGRAYG